MKINHRFRLAAVSAVASGFVLAVIFGAIILFARNNALGQKRTDLASALNSLTLDENEPFDIHEFDEAHPELSVAVFPGSRPDLVGAFNLRPIVGFRKEKGRLLFGKRFRGDIIVAAADWQDTESQLRVLALVLAGLWLPLTFVIGVATWIAARIVFRPLHRLTAQASTAAGSDLAVRLNPGDEAEFGEFAHALNGMLDRIETAVRRGDRFAADAAHELRTPLAILRTRLETALLNPRTTEEYEQTLRRAVLEVTRLTDITQALLQTARGEVAVVEPIDLAPIALETAGLDTQCEVEPVRAAITPEEVRILLNNLLDNARRFAPEGSTIRVKLARVDGWLELSVRDEGPGFPAGLEERAFDRLVRGDDSRNRASGGAGIGLSVCRSIARSRGGEAFYRPPAEGGPMVVIRLPVAE